MISIVSGTLNRVELLPKVIENTVNGCERVELVLVDGGSTDGTIDYLKSLNHPRIKLIEVGHRSRYAHYMNIGIRNSTYELVCQWNDDVLLMNSWNDIINTIDDSDYYIFSWLRGTTDEFYNNKKKIYGKNHIFYFPGVLILEYIRKMYFEK